MNEALRQSVLDLMNRYGIGLFEYEGLDGKLVVDAERLVQAHSEVLAEAPGVFLWAHSVTSEVSVWPRQVSKGEVIGWLKVGPLLRPVLAREDAVLLAPVLADGAVAGFGVRLF